MKVYENQPVYAEYRGRHYRGVVNNKSGAEYETLVVTFQESSCELQTEPIERAVERSLLSMVKELDDQQKLTPAMCDPYYE